MNDDELWFIWRVLIEPNFTNSHYDFVKTPNHKVILALCLEQQFWGEFFSEVR
jgi:hypothetical protein